MNLELGRTVTLKVKNVLWPSRDRYASYVRIPEFNVYTGTLMSERWFAPNEIGITTGDPNFPFRRIDKERIVAVNDVEVEQAKHPTQEIEDQVFQVLGSKGAIYQVSLGRNGRASCSCPGYQFRGRCKHADGVMEDQTKKRGTENVRTEAVPSS